MTRRHLLGGPESIMVTSIVRHFPSCCNNVLKSQQIPCIWGSLMITMQKYINKLGHSSWRMRWGAKHSPHLKGRGNGTWHLALHLALGIWHLALGTGTWARGAWHLALGTWNMTHGNRWRVLLDNDSGGMVFLDTPKHDDGHVKHYVFCFVIFENPRSIQEHLGSF